MIHNLSVRPGHMREMLLFALKFHSYALLHSSKVQSLLYLKINPNQIQIPYVRE